MGPKKKKQANTSKSAAPATSPQSSSSSTPSPAPLGPPPPATIGHRSEQRFFAVHPGAASLAKVGRFSLLGESDRRRFEIAEAIAAAARTHQLDSFKPDFWKAANREGVPLGQLRRNYDWGPNSRGGFLGEYCVEDYNRRALKRGQLTGLEILQRRSNTRRLQVLQAERLCEKPDPDVVEDCHEQAISSEIPRDLIARLRMELYGQKTGPYARNPEWDDVVPVPQPETGETLAPIIYPEDYAEAVAYLRAVMGMKEYSPRCLRLTEDVIDKNPAHYTVWLYRFKIITELNVPIDQEFEWLDEVSLTLLKNYQIWHHRQLLLAHALGKISTDDEAARGAVADREHAFVTRILAEDAKNYHVWSYRQFLVRKLGTWPSSGPRGEAELAAIRTLIDDDVRNNSAWSHRFFLVFSDPAGSTVVPEGGPARSALDPDPAVPAAVIDRERDLCLEKIRIAPQSASGWNYLRGVLAKGGRDLAEVQALAEEFARNLGDEEKEEVTSSHALELLADVHESKGRKDDAMLCWNRLADKWDPIRAGYWHFRRRTIRA